MITSDAVMAVAVLGGIASVAWSATVAWVYWLKHRFDESRPRRVETVGDDARFARIEAAMDALTLEIERIGEAQRFTAKLLEERLPLRLQAKPSTGDSGRVITPH